MANKTPIMIESTWLHYIAIAIHACMCKMIIFIQSAIIILHGCRSNMTNRSRGIVATFIMHDLLWVAISLHVAIHSRQLHSLIAIESECNVHGYIPADLESNQLLQKFSRNKSLNFVDGLHACIIKNIEVKFLRIGTNDCHTHSAYLNFQGSSKILENLENFTPRKFLAVR